MDSESSTADASDEHEADRPEERVADNEATEVTDMTERRTEGYVYEAVEQAISLRFHRIRARPTRSMGSLPTVEAIRGLRLRLDHFNQIDQERRLEEHAS